MRVALAELYARAQTGEGSADLADLAEHVHDLLGILDAGLAEVAADPDADMMRDFARAITARLATIERELAGRRLHLSARVERATGRDRLSGWARVA